MSFGHSLANGVRNVFAYFTPVPKSSQFADKGILTPQEFVEAGDQLVYKFPSWKWQRADDGYKVNWLPAEKQYLITQNVPCKLRLKDLDKQLLYDNEEDWMLPGFVDETAIEDIPDAPELSRLSTDARTEPLFQISNDYIKSCDAPSEQSDDALDISGMDNSESMLLNEDDPAAADGSSYFVRNIPASEILPTRTYDLSITYDKFYQTPRLWLFGYNENGIPLEPQKIFEDIIPTYVKKTVTVDGHPCTGIPTASIHPCGHAGMLKKVVSNWKEQNRVPRPDMVIFMLLKFVSSVIPLIEYDYTMDIDFLKNSQGN